MLGSRTKQVNSYGRRGSRIVNASDRREQESADSSEVASDADAHTPHPFRTLKRENALTISPTRNRASLYRFKGLSRSARDSPLAQSRNVQPRATRDATQRLQSKAQSGAQVRQPLTPLHTSSNEHKIKGKSKAPAIKCMRASLKPHSPVVAVDIIVLDEEGNMLTQERRLSHPEIQVRTATGKGKRIPRTSPPSPPPVTISDDTDSGMVSPKPLNKRSNRRRHAIIVSSDESEADVKITAHKKPPDPIPKPRSKSESLRVEVVIPPAPYLKSKVAKIPTNSSSLDLINSRTITPPAPYCGPDLVVAPSHLIPPFPVPKQRQLTPIRGGPSRSVFRPPLTPSTPTEADLSLDLAELSLSDPSEIYNVTAAQPEYLIPLLNECLQTSPYEFSAFIETFPFDPIVQSSTEDEDARFRKIGEASYSEVFGIGDVVLKIIPVRSEEGLIRETFEMPAPSDAKDVLKEIVVTREIGENCDKFVRLLKTYVVRGRYPSLLLDLWDEYNERKGSESIRPDSFGLAQVYVIIILPNGGPDLESFAFKNASKSGWQQACGIFWQVARALEQAEQLAHFEHRDLHWGQILVKNVPIKKLTSKSSRVAMDDARFGVKVTIIDLGLARMGAADDPGSQIYWTPFDQEIFEGEGDYQYDVYRMMRDVIGGSWKSYHPFTNVMWLHYLVTKLLREKRLKLPGGKRQTGGERAVSLTGYDEQECYDCLAEMEKLLGNSIISARKGQKARRKTVISTSGLKCASDVIVHGVRQGWVH